MGNEDSDRDLEAFEALEAADEDDAPGKSDSRQQRGLWWIVIGLSFLAGWVRWGQHTFAYHS